MAKIASRKRSKHPSQATKVLVVLSMGIGLGLMLGWVLMGTLHAFMEVGYRGLQHHGHDQQSAIDDQAARRNFEKSSSQQQHHRKDIDKSSTKSATKSDSNWYPTTGNTIHVLVTSGGGPYQNLQSRWMYGTYKMAQKMPGGDKLVGFTRILHRVQADNLMQEIPTFHAESIEPACDIWCDFPPHLRPNAVQQFFDAAKKDPSMIKAPWILMTECDYVWFRPVQAPRAETSQGYGIAFPFGYIDPTYPTVVPLMKKLYNGDPKEIPRTGPAPALMLVSDWVKVTPDWERLTAEIEADEEAKEVLGWVREMYAFSVALAIQKVEMKLVLPPLNELMVQPPADHAMGAAAIAHYTWGPIISDKTGKEIWRFDKREYTDEKYEINPPHLAEVPPFDPEGGWVLQDKVPVTSALRDTLAQMISLINKATEQLQPLQ